MSGHELIEILKALLTGLVVGAVFTAVKLPIPAPGVPAGVAGIIGIYFGYVFLEFSVQTLTPFLL